MVRGGGYLDERGDSYKKNSHVPSDNERKTFDERKEGNIRRKRRGSTVHLEGTPCRERRE